MSEENHCPQCGAALPAQSPQGLCPGCLLKWGLESQTGGEETGSEPAAADRPPPTPEEIAAHFPDLEILELVGRGGMGVVYKARQKHLDRLVAIKILAPKVGQDPAFAERFAREARAMAMLNHPHVVAVHDFGQTDGLYYFLMEFVDGVNLRRLLDTDKLAPEEALAIVPQICEALQYAHDHGVVHRDIKPENVLLDKEGRVKIADFGIAKLVGKEAKDLTLTGAGQIIGTPQYMAPEQIEHPLQVDHRADIYSLGVVFYQMLTGELPIGRFAPPSKKVQIDVRLDEVVLRALEKEPERRYQQASDVKTQVENIVTTPDASGEAAGQVPASSRLLKVSKCYLSTPEHLRSLRGRCLYLFKAKGELRLDDETLSFHSSWPTIVIPLSSIRKIGQGDFPYSAKPLPLEYIAVTYAEHGVERTVLLAPFAGALLPTTANENVEQWLWALQEAIRTRTGQTLSVERPWLTQDKFSTAKMLLLSAATLAVAIIVFTGLLTLVSERRLPNANELLFGPVFAVVSTLLTFVALWERRRRAIASGNLDALIAAESGGSLHAKDARATGTPTTGDSEGAFDAPQAAVPRLSKTALTGAIWGGPFFLIIVLALCGIILWTTLSIRHLEPLLSPILLVLLATPIGVPILGYVALNQIRHSAGRLYGLELALFDLWAFPLLALDAVIAGLTIFPARALTSGPGGVIALFFIVIACVVIDFLIVRWVWRAVNRRPTGALSVDQPKRGGLKTMLSVAAPVLMFCLGVFGFAFLLWSVAERVENSRARIHTRVFEADGKLVDELVPRPTRQPAKAYDYALEIPGRDPQTAQVNAAVFGRLLADGANPPGLLDDQSREGNWWPKRATSSHYSRRDKVAGHGLVDGYLGVRRHKDILQLRVQYRVLHGMNGPYQYALIDWEGSVPPPETARAFFIPYSRGDGTARYLVIALEVSDGAEHGEGVSEVRGQQSATSKPEQPAAPQGPVLIYEVDLSSASAGASVPDMDRLLKAIDQRLNAGPGRLARVRKLNDGRIEVVLMRNNDKDQQRVERLLAKPGTLEFRILASSRTKKGTHLFF